MGRKIVSGVFLTTWRTAVYETRTHGGVRASLCQRLLMGRATRLPAGFYFFKFVSYSLSIKCVRIFL